MAVQLRGGEVCLWGEQNAEEDYESLLFPRVSAAAERLWSPREVRDPECAQQRLRFSRMDMVRHGNDSVPFLRAKAISPPFCDKNSHVCNVYEFAGAGNMQVLGNCSSHRDDDLSMVF